MEKKHSFLYTCLLGKSLEKKMERISHLSKKRPESEYVTGCCNLFKQGKLSVAEFFRNKKEY